MSPDTPASPSSRSFGPLLVLRRSLGRHLFGLFLAFIGFSIIDWAIDPHTVPTSGVIYGAIGVFVLCNGLYVGGVRIR
ncbi:hypothetical protein [Haladaptatus sp. T7]|uniref:hypothetical protein n=1 Tax=Haladaptatus sp. T7 TaxID=2029368 RepID=UPI0021A257E5|nr:hypothetical protein [Haladaptatus sp. T7]GKZ12997.1 hypothetical protein HAL_08780 [Haladaptatus sp. T7]